MEETVFKNNEMKISIVYFFVLIIIISVMLFILYIRIKPTNIFSFFPYTIILALFFMGPGYMINFNLNGYYKYFINDEQLILHNKFIVFKKREVIELRDIKRVLVMGADRDYNSEITPWKKGGRNISIICSNHAYFMYVPNNLYEHMRGLIGIKFEFIKSESINKFTKEYNIKKSGH